MTWPCSAGVNRCADVSTWTQEDKRNDDFSDHNLPPNDLCGNAFRGGQALYGVHLEK